VIFTPAASGESVAVPILPPLALARLTVTGLVADGVAAVVETSTRRFEQATAEARRAEKSSVCVVFVMA
jgi:hypothetical protein